MKKLLGVLIALAIAIPAFALTGGGDGVNGVQYVPNADTSSTLNFTTLSASGVSGISASLTGGAASAVFRVGNQTSGGLFTMPYVSNPQYYGFYPSGVTPSALNSFLYFNQANTYLNATAAIYQALGSVVKTTLNATGFTVATLIIPSTTIGIQGTILADNAQSGSWGEFVSATAATPGTSLTSASAVNATSKSLTAGDWDVSGVCDFTPAATTSLTQKKCGINTSSGTFGGQDTYIQESYAAMVTGANLSNVNSPVSRINISSGGTAYLVCQSTFSVSTMSCAGTIRARRVR